MYLCFMLTAKFCISRGKKTWLVLGSIFSAKLLTNQFTCKLDIHMVIKCVIDCSSYMYFECTLYMVLMMEEINPPLTPFNLISQLLSFVMKKCFKN